MKIILSQEQVLQALRMYAQALTGHDLEKAVYFIYKEEGEWEVKIEMKASPKLPEPKVVPKQVSQDEIEKIYAPVAKRTPDVT